MIKNFILFSFLLASFASAQSKLDAQPGAKALDANNDNIIKLCGAEGFKLYKRDVGECQWRGCSYRKTDGSLNYRGSNFRDIDCTQQQVDQFITDVSDEILQEGDKERQARIKKANDDFELAKSESNDFRAPVDARKFRELLASGKIDKNGNLLDKDGNIIPNRAKVRSKSGAKGGDDDGEDLSADGSSTRSGKKGGPGRSSERGGRKGLSDGEVHVASGTKGAGGASGGVTIQLTSGMACYSECKKQTECDFLFFGCEEKENLDLEDCRECMEEKYGFVSSAAAAHGGGKDGPLTMSGSYKAGFGPGSAGMKGHFKVGVGDGDVTAADIHGGGSASIDVTGGAGDRGGRGKKSGRFNHSSDNSDEDAMGDDYHEMRSRYQVDCINCGVGGRQQSTLSGVAEIIGAIAPPLAMFGSAYVGAKAYENSNKAWAGAAQVGFEQCRLSQNDYLTYLSANELPGLTPEQKVAMHCNGYQLGGFAGMGGQFGGLYGQGYSPGFIGGMMGPYGMYQPYGMGGFNSGMAGGLSIGIAGGMAGGVPGGYMGGMYQAGINGGMYPGGMYPGGMNGGLVNGISLAGGVAAGMPGGYYPGGIQSGMYPGGMYPGGMYPGNGGYLPNYQGGIAGGGLVNGISLAGGVNAGGMYPGGMYPGGGVNGMYNGGFNGGMYPGGINGGINGGIYGPGGIYSGVGGVGYNPAGSWQNPQMDYMASVQASQRDAMLQQQGAQAQLGAYNFGAPGANYGGFGTYGAYNGFGSAGASPMNLGANLSFGLGVAM